MNGLLLVDVCNRVIMSMNVISCVVDVRLGDFDIGGD